MGVPAKPSAIRKLEGDLSKGKSPNLTNKEPKPKSDAVAPPQWLQDEGGKALQLWLKDAPEHERLGTLTNVDCHSFAMRCHYLAQFVRLAREVRDEGEAITTNGDKTICRNPKCGEKQNAFKNYIEMARRFGESPADRARLDVAPPVEGDGGILGFIGASA